MPAEFPLLHDPDHAAATDTWPCRIPIIGWQIAGLREYGNQRMLVNQAVARGPVPESEWMNYHYNREIRTRLEEIVRRRAYPDEATFHPRDPFELMMVLRYGDLNEIEIMMDIENEFGIEFDDQLTDWVLTAKVSFIEFIHYLEQHGKISRPKGG